MENPSDILTQLRVEAALCGPENHDPPMVRARFPMIALPRVLRKFVAEAADAMGIAVESVATPAIATCATAIGSTCRARINSAWSEPSVIWAVTLMESGQLKTPAYNAAFEPLRVAQRLYEEKFADDVARFKKAKADHEADALFVNRHPSDDKPALVEPVEPKPVDLYTSDSTVEAIGLLFANNPRGLAFTRDELSGFFASFGAYKGGRGGDESAYLEFYNAGSVKLNRASGKRIYVHAAAMSIFGTCQPAVFINAIGANGKSTNQVENGLAARFLLAAPEPRVKQWRDPKPIEGRHYHKMIAELLSIPCTMDADGRTQPAMIDFTPEAKDLFGLYVKEHGQYTREIENAALRYHYAKLESVAARLALIFYLCDGATEQLATDRGIEARHVLAGIALARWFGREAARVYDSYESDTEREKRDLLDSIKANGGTISLTEMRSLKRRWQNSSAAEMALRALVRGGYGELVVDESGGKGGRPATRFRLTEVPPQEEHWP